jgi:hypothetical protein
VACGLAKKGLAAIPRGYDAHLKAYSTRELGYIRKNLADITAGKAIYMHTLKGLIGMKAHVEKARGEMSAPLAKFHLAAQPALFDEWNTAAKGLDSALASAKQKSALSDATFKDGSLGTLALGRAKTVGVTAKPVAYGFSKNEAHIEKNALGIPTAKFRYGKVLVQFPGESFCRAFEITLRADYAGGGKYAQYVLVDRDPVEDNDALWVGSCGGK